MILAFDDCELDTDRRELRRAGAAVHVQPQVFGVLAYLVEHRDRVVPRTELLDHVWGDRFVAEATLTSRIRAARRAVGDDGAGQRVIRTVHRHGYRFVAAVAGRPGAAGGPAGAAPAPLLERDQALDALGAALDEAAAGTGRVVLVHGEPGIGKTALVQAFAAGCGDRAPVYAGACDDLVTPPPFGPLHDVAQAIPALAEALAAGAPPATVHRLVLAEIGRSAHPTVLVVEDAHWADEATLDLITFLGRRIGTAPGLLVLTYRDTEVGDGHPLVPVIGSLPATAVRRVPLAPLSRDAVAALVGEARAGPVMAGARGNPFFVTELAASAGGDVPPSVRQAVLARVARLPEPARDLLSVVAVAPGRLEIDVLEALHPGWVATAAPAERSGMLVVDASHVQFRHELARLAVLDATPGARRREVHRRLVALLGDRGADPARIVHHAEAGGDRAALATHALRAARQAAAASAHREAYSQYRRALRCASDLAPGERARIHEEASREAYLTTQEDDALADAGAALAAYVEVGDMPGAGRMHRWLSRVHWYGGRRAQADAAARRAVAVLEPLGPSVELAWAYSNMAQLAMLADDDDAVARWGSDAAELAERLGERAVTAHARINLAMIATRRDPDDEGPLREAAALADTAGEHHEATRALLNLAYTLMEASRLERAAEVGEQARRYAVDHEVDALAHYVEAIIARIDVLAGRWAGAADRLRTLAETGGLVTRLLALSTLALLQVRRGDPRAGGTLASAWDLAVPAGELQRLAPLASAAAERAWLAGTLTVASPYLLDCYRRQRGRSARTGELARWLREAGCRVDDPGPEVERPHRLELLGRWDDAAAAWRARHMPYDEAFCLAHTPDRRDEALAIAEALGARPLADRIRGFVPSPRSPRSPVG
ncbi:MAG TPA: AAA family ATPase [Acidimicrobiales bacterium]